MPKDLEGEFVLEENPPVAAKKKVKSAAVEPEAVETAEASEEVTEPKILSQGKNHASFYSNIVINPDNITFENQEEDEEIVLLVRRDLITNVPWILAAVLLAVIPPLIFALSSFFTPFFQLSILTQLILTIFYYLIVAGFVIVEFAIWYFNIGLVTNRRIIDFDVTGILSKHLSETRLNIIEDVSYTQVGAVRSIFDYGDIYMQTAGTNVNFEFDRSPQPAKITRLIADRIGGAR
jgi:hypothetical protein